MLQLLVIIENLFSELLDNSSIFFIFVGESIPIRLFLGGYDLTPTMRDVNKKFSVRFLLNLVLVDEEERRYFKQQVNYLFNYSQEY